MASSRGELPPGRAARPAGWAWYPLAGGLALGVIAPQLLAGLPWWSALVAGAAVAVIGVAGVRAQWPMAYFGRPFVDGASWYAAVVGLATAAWLLVAQGAPLDGSRWRWLVLGVALLAGWFAVLVWRAPSWAAAVTDALGPVDTSAEHGIYVGVMHRAGVLPGARIVKVTTSPSGGVDTVHLVPHRAEGVRPLTFAGLMGRHAEIVAEADQALGAARDIEIDDSDVAITKTSGARWQVHITVRRVMTGDYPYPIRTTPRPAGEPSRLGRYETDEDVLLHGFHPKQGAAHLDVLAGTGGGKALDLHTPVPTPSGWTTMGALQDGDELFDERGQVCRVVKAHAVRLDRPCYRVTFSDGEQIVADAEHLWWTEDRAARRARWRGTLRPQSVGRVRDTEEIAATLRTGRGYLNHTVPVASALQLPDRDDLLIPPYVLGVWLGDGAHRDGRVTSGDGEELRGLLAAEGYETGPNQAGPDRAETFRVIGLQPQLRKLGLLRDSDESEKHIPADYLRASEAQRRALLAGLLDTDGTTCPHGRVQFDSTSGRLARDVLELALSLGYRATIWDKDAKLNGRVISRVWRVSFTSPDPVFRLARKLAAQAVRAARHSRERTCNRFITSVEPVPTRPVRCITVDSPSRLYLVGRAMVPTHNTTALDSLVAEDLGCDAWEVWLMATRKLVDLAWPWLRPWLAGLTDRPVIDRVCGQSQQEVLLGLAEALQLAEMWNAESAGTRQVRPGHPGLTVILDEASDCLKDPMTITFPLGGKTVTMNASQIVAKLAELARTAPIRVVRASQYGLFDTYGKAGSESMRNFTSAIVGRVTRHSDAQAVASGMPPGFRPTELRNNAVYVQPSVEEPIALRAKLWALYVDDDAPGGPVDHIEPVVAAYTRWRGGLDPASTARLACYADRWNPARLPELVAFAARHGLAWRLPGQPATPAATPTGGPAGTAPPTSTSTPAATVAPGPTSKEPPMTTADLPSDWHDTGFDVWAAFDQTGQGDQAGEREPAAAPTTATPPEPGSVLAAADTSGIRDALDRWAAQEDEVAALARLPEPLGRILAHMLHPRAQAIVSTGWVPTEVLAMSLGRCSRDDDDATKRRAVEQLGLELRRIVGADSEQMPRAVDSRRRRGWRVDVLREAGKRLTAERRRDDP